MILSIAFPSKGYVDPAFAHALRYLIVPRDFEKWECLYSTLSGDTAEGRNDLAENSQGDYIMFLDDDVLPPPDTIIKLMAHKKDMVSGLYFSRRKPYFPQAYIKNKDNPKLFDSLADYPKNELVEVDACGMGCALIKKEVFKKLNKPYFHYLPRGDKNLRKGEDFFFCEQVKKAGYSIFLDTSVICAHVGTMYVGPEFWEVSRGKLDYLKETMGDKKFEEYKKKVIEIQNKKQFNVHK